MCIIESTVKTMDYLSLVLLLPLKQHVVSLMEWPWLKASITALVSFIAFFIHENVLGVGVLVGLVILDQLTGVWVAIRNNSFNSSSFRNGLIKLLLYFVILGSFHSLSYTSIFIFGWMSLDTGALAWLSLTEVISIVENSCNLLGLPFPQGLLDKLRIFANVVKKKDK